MRFLAALIALVLGSIAFFSLTSEGMDTANRLSHAGAFSGAIGYSVFAMGTQRHIGFGFSYMAAVAGGVLLPTGVFVVGGAADPLGVAAWALGNSLVLGIAFGGVIPLLQFALRGLPRPAREETTSNPRSYTDDDEGDEGQLNARQMYDA